MKRLRPCASWRSPEQSSAELRMESDTPPSEGDGDRRLPYADEPILLLTLPSRSPPAAGNASNVGGRVDTCSGGGDESSASKKRPRPTCLTTSPETPPPKADGGLGFKDDDSPAAADERSAPQILRKRKLPTSLTNPPPPTSAEEPAMEALSDDNSPPMSLLDCIRIITEMLRRDK